MGWPSVYMLNENTKTRLIFLGVLSIAFAGATLYSNILYAPFIFDDYDSIVENESIRNLAGTAGDISNNRYLPLISFAFNYALGGLKPFDYHLINNFIHIINALLVYYLVVFTFRTPYFRIQKTEHGSPFTDSPFFIAFSSAFIFVAHPIQTQAVTYIAQRATSMAAMFYLLSLVMYIKWRLKNQMQDAGYKIQDVTPLNPPLVRGEVKGGIMHRASWIMYLCSLLSAVLAMKTKEIAFTLPVIISLYEFSFFNATQDSRLKTQNWKRFLYLLPILLTLLIIPLSILNFKAPAETITQDINLASRETPNITRTDYLFTQFRVIMTYIRLLIFPINQSLDYSYPIYKSFFAPQVFLSFLFLLLIFGAGVYLFYRFSVAYRVLRLVAFGIFWFFITLSVESSIIPIRDVIVEHRLYLPSIGLFIGFTALSDYLLSDRRMKVILMVIIVGLLSISAYHRNIVWKSPQTLWADVIAQFPNSSRAYNNLGVAFKKQGEFDKAIEQFEKSLKADKNYTAVYFNLGDVQYRLGNYDNAVIYLKQALTGRLDPQLHLDILNKLGRTYSAMGQTMNAIKTFKEAIRVSPDSIAPYNNLGVQYTKIGEFDSAIEMFEKALKIRNEQYLYSNLYIVYAKKRERDETALGAKK